MAVTGAKFGLTGIVIFLFLAMEFVVPEDDNGTLAASYALVLAVSLAVGLLNWSGKAELLAQFFVQVFGTASALLTAWFWIESEGGAVSLTHAILVYGAMMIASTTILIALFSRPLTNDDQETSQDGN